MLAFTTALCMCAGYLPTIAEIVPETTVTNIVSDEKLCSWVINDYKSKTKSNGIVNTIINKTATGQYEITLTDNSEIYPIIGRIPLLLSERSEQK